MINLAEIEEAEQLLAANDIDIAKREPYYFLTQLCYTMDEHWKAKGLKSPFNLIPPKEYIRDICDVFVAEDLIAMEKTRQMLATWIASGLALWHTMFHEGRRTFIMSKKEKDADSIIDRIKIIYDRLPGTMKSAYKADPHSYLKIEWSKRNSVIQGIPQGPDQVRSYTSSLIIMDEASFQDKAEKVFEAAQPSLQGGGKFMAISTPNGMEWFYRTVYDQN